MSKCPPIKFHEKQVRSLCGKHAINNLLQKKKVTCKKLEKIADSISNEFDIPKSQLLDVDSGYYDVSILVSYLKENYEVHEIQEVDFIKLSRRQSNRLIGYIMGDGHHWVCVRKMDNKDCYFLIDSLDDEAIHIKVMKHFLEDNDYVIALKVLSR